MGIKERERRVEVFFYGLFMDEELLRGKGLEPEGDEIAAIDGFGLRVGQRAALVPTPWRFASSLRMRITAASSAALGYSRGSTPQAGRSARRCA